MELTKEELFLLKKAQEAARKAYAPYSKYRVGAALLTAGKTIYTACNIENASYSLTMCAERNAVAKAVCNGEKSFLVMVVYVDSKKLFSPCGACRQVLSEFSPEMKIIYANEKQFKVSTVRELLPDSFTL